MSQDPISISKQRTLKPAEDYYRLRREGIGFIEQMGSQKWTDYNTHDPGITILEACCYAITDLAYRSSWDIKDLLTPAEPASDPLNPLPDQAFFSARQILTTHPWTLNDFRLLLIDQPFVRNAWLNCDPCVCNAHYFAWCADNELKLAYQISPELKPSSTLVTPRGMYEVLLELEHDAELGDLNNRKIEFTYQEDVPGEQPRPVLMELRFPDWGLYQPTQLALFVNEQSAFEMPGLAQTTFKVIQFGATKDYNLLNDPGRPGDEAKNQYIRDNWRNVFFVTFEITLPSKQKITIEFAALKLLGDNYTRRQCTLTKLLGQLEAHFILPYRKKFLKTAEAVRQAKDKLQSQRNLSEDYCRVKMVNLEEVAVCADIIVAVDADIEKIQAQIWYEIETYFNPAIPFYSLAEMQADGIASEDIFNGPKLNNGFVKKRDLEEAGLKTVLRTSDIVNRLMDIEGVLAVNHLQLSKYDASGNLIKGAADPKIIKKESTADSNTSSAKNEFDFDSSTSSAKWALYISELHQPRLYFNASKFLFYKNDLPFLPRMQEAKATLMQLRGANERPKRKAEQSDLPIPTGTFRNPGTYWPIQYSLPLTYGVGIEGLPSTVSPARKAQAKQLKAYLLFFEQMLANGLAQMAQIADLFSINPDVTQSYFVKAFDESIIKGFTDLNNGLTEKNLQALIEEEDGYAFLQRRNQFLDHLLARFASSFSEYALLLGSTQGILKSRKQLINDKINFLKVYPEISHNRAKAINHQLSSTDLQNFPGLKQRVNLFLGFPGLQFRCRFVGTTKVNFQLVDGFGKTCLEGTAQTSTLDHALAQKQIYRTLLQQMADPNTYALEEDLPDGYYLLLLDDKQQILGKSPTLFTTSNAALSRYEELIAWSTSERMIVVEHILLRPKFIGDALYPACIDGDCRICGTEDAYSFRLTLLVPGWTHPYNTNLEMRRFAERSMRQEIPAHLLAKICWVANDGAELNICDPIVAQLADLLEQNGFIKGTTNRPSHQDACTCAKEIYTAFNQHFEAWFADKIHEVFNGGEWQNLLQAEFEQVQISEKNSCLVDYQPLWGQIKPLMLTHYTQIALKGWQFERFEYVWENWMSANAAIDWGEERLQERIEALLQSQKALVPLSRLDRSTLSPCQCAAFLLQAYGQGFYEWMLENIKQKRSPQTMGHFAWKATDVPLCEGYVFDKNTSNALVKFLNESYTRYTNVSYWLHLLLTQLAELRSTYPAATLHDCDDGSDENPVRLGNTVIGSNVLRRRATSLLSQLPLYEELPTGDPKPSAIAQGTTKSASRSATSKKPPAPKKDPKKRPPRKS